jgi:hypothetical protein
MHIRINKAHEFFDSDSELGGHSSRWNEIVNGDLRGEAWLDLDSSDSNLSIGRAIWIEATVKTNIKLLARTLWYGSRISHETGRQFQMNIWYSSPFGGELTVRERDLNV